ncbi:MAG: polyhydroxybutyrate depolymerase [Rhodobacteraceae bacterium]|nr:MAG: polyhydroxybutyrate depolymerase [Paracoccaceae bacterium]
MLRFSLVIALTVTLFTALFTAQSASACGADSDCVIDNGRIYRIRMPANATNEKVGAIVFAHGYRGSAAGVMRNKSLARMADRLGVALIALDAGGEDWALANAPHPMGGRDVLAYVDNVLADATQQFAIDPDRIMASGFSAGGMLVWTLACERANSFAGFVAMSGTFWAPVPATCPGPAASLIHIHGDADKTVPLLGRAIGATRQGEVPKALEMYARLGGFGPSKSTQNGKLRCETRRNDTDDILTYCEFSGGHSFRTEYLRQAWEMLVEAGQL